MQPDQFYSWLLMTSAQPCPLTHPQFPGPSPSKRPTYNELQLAGWFLIVRTLNLLGVHLQEAASCQAAAQIVHDVGILNGVLGMDQRLTRIFQKSWILCLKCWQDIPPQSSSQL
eukprot:m.130959 g.130959  ORF g.130959 m.130959 type:complete len:114 (-) comp23715_c0_seq3:1172-1513(-)